MNDLQKLEVSAYSIKDLLDQIFKEDSKESVLLKRILACRISGFEGSSPSLLSVYYNIETLKIIALGSFALAYNSGQNLPLIKHIILKKGNATLPLKLAEKLKNSVHCNKVLKTVNIDDSQSQIQLVFQDGSIENCDKLVLAIPCTVYKDINFDTNIIPTTRLSKINQVQYGSNAKILLPIKYNLTQHHAVLTDDMIAFFNIDRKLLNLYFLGKDGSKLLTNLSDILQKSLSALKSGFKDAIFKKDKPLIAKDEQFTKYTTSVAKSWVEDPYSKGSYSNYGLDLKELFAEETTYKNVKVKKLFEPIDDRVFFVGEHTTVGQTTGGTMEAAVESGERIVQLF